MFAINPQVSIIIPVYNVEKYVRFCVDSILKQTLKNIEIILVDDGSTDLSGQICDEYAKLDSRVKVIHQTNRGLGLTRNSGIKVATGEYIGFVDSDDAVSAEMFQILYENAKKCYADISYCSYKKFYLEDELKNQKSAKPNILKIYNGNKEIKQYMLDRIGMEPSSKLDNLYGASVWCGIFLRKMLSSADASFVSERQFIAEDMIFDIEVIPNCNTIVHCGTQLYYYRYNPNSLTTVYKEDRFEKNVALFHEMYKRLLLKFSDKELFNSMSRYLLTTARIAIIQEVNFIKKNGWKKVKCNILKICSNKNIISILNEYEYSKMPYKYALTCYLMKNKKVDELIILYFCFLKIKYNRCK